MPELSIIIPVYNEEENIVPLFNELIKFVPENFELLFVDDGSTDHTYLEIESLSKIDTRIKCISFSRNFGHQNAFIAGLEHASGNVIITMDGDLQDPPSLIPELINKINAGFDIVFTKKDKEENLPALKRITSKLFYKLLHFLSDTNIEPESADFRAFNKKVQQSVLQFKERQLFLRGIFSWIGFNRTYLTFNRPGRLKGKTKYTYAKMLGLGLKGTTSFSFKPLRVSLLIGAIVSLFAFSFAFYALISYFQGKTIQGWASTIIAMMLMGGIQLLVIGLLGEYIASMFIEVKNRPLYLIKDTINL